MEYFQWKLNFRFVIVWGSCLSAFNHSELWRKCRNGGFSLENLRNRVSDQEIHVLGIFVNFIACLYI